jgi:drug/metabolite transporter (DMT)-like permease
MNQRLTPATALLMLLPPMMWAGNAIVGRLMNDDVPAMTLNLLRWVVAAVLLAPWGWSVWRERALVRAAMPRLLALALAGMFSYNSFQYLALDSSTPINVTLVASIMPVWMLLAGRVFFGVRVRRQALIATGFTLSGVLLVLSRGDIGNLLRISLVPGDAWMLMATLGWTAYSWLLAQPTPEQRRLSANWAGFLWIQILLGIGWSALATLGEWWLFPQWGAPPAHMAWNAGVWAALLYVGIGPALIAYRAWGVGVSHVGPNIAVFFASLTPVFAATLSVLVLGDLPHWYHYVAFGCILAGIFISSRPSR